MLSEKKKQKTLQQIESGNRQFLDLNLNSVRERIDVISTLTRNEREKRTISGQHNDTQAIRRLQQSSLNRDMEKRSAFDSTKKKTKRVYDNIILTKNSVVKRKNFGKKNSLPCSILEKPIASQNVSAPEVPSYDSPFVDGTSVEHDRPSANIMKQKAEYHLQVFDVEYKDAKVFIKANCKKTQNQYDVICEGNWGQTKVLRQNRIKIFDPVILSQRELLINNKDGAIIVEPNTLISSTTIVSSLWCERKALLSEKFRIPQCSIEMKIGTVCHELFQRVLLRRPKIISPAWLMAEFRGKIFPKIILDLIVLGVSCEEFESQLQPYLLNITKWMRNFFEQLTNASDNLNETKITDIEDIEMNIWSNNVGIKGIIDVALKTTNNTIIPLELKTGKGVLSISHRAQVLMYTILASELNDGKIDSGMLIFLKDGIETIVDPAVTDLKGILQVRNKLAGFLRSFEIERFPNPKLETRFCESCQYAKHCTILQKVTPPANISEEMTFFANELTSHLSEADIAYGRKWIKWTFMEWKAQQKDKNMEGFFSKSPKEREIDGTCLSDLILKNTEKIADSVYWHTFSKKSQAKLPPSAMEKGQMVTISTNDFLAVQTGFVVDEQETIVIVKTEKEFRKCLKNSSTMIFHIDHYISYAAFQLQLNSIIELLDNTSEAKRLRGFIIDQKEPTVGRLRWSDILIILPILQKLSPIQAKAVLKALAAEDYVLIQGFPGSGKTSTIAALVQCILLLGKTVLLAAYTNSAVDNMLLKLIKTVPSEKMLRIGRYPAGSNLEDIKSCFLEIKLAEFTNKKTAVNDAGILLRKIPIVATTCLTAVNHPYFLLGEYFEYCIIDEAAQALESSLAKPILLAKKYVLVGDFRQLEPIIKCEEAKKEGMSVSLMERLTPIAEKANASVKLNTQYRMNEQICKISSKAFYEGLLQCATPEIAKQTIEDAERQCCERLLPDDLIDLLLSSKLEDAVVFLDTQSRIAPFFTQIKSSSSSKSNRGEVDLIMRICQTYLSVGFDASAIGVMSTYRNQVEELRKSLPSSIETSTIDQFQGRDKDIILVSLVSTSSQSNLMNCNTTFLSERRINVALTRAKKKMIVIGCLESLNAYPVMRKIIEMMDNVYKFSE